MHHFASIYLISLYYSVQYNFVKSVIFTASLIQTYLAYAFSSKATQNSVESVHLP